MKNIAFLKSTYGLLSVIIISMTMSSCANRTDSEATAKADVSANEWTNISPEEIVNSVKLFGDWMALAAGQKDDMNAMTISWGQLGILWGKPVVTVYVSPSRYTHEFMERNDYFTVTAFPEQYRTALEYIGSHSGRDGDKLKAAGLTPEFTALGNPIFEEANLAIECKTIYSVPFDSTKFTDDVSAIYGRGQMLPHTLYIGEIVNVLKK